MRTAIPPRLRVPEGVNSRGRPSPSAPDVAASHTTRRALLQVCPRRRESGGLARQSHRLRTTGLPRPVAAGAVATLYLPLSDEAREGREDDPAPGDQRGLDDINDVNLEGRIRTFATNDNRYHGSTAELHIHFSVAHVGGQVRRTEQLSAVGKRSQPAERERIERLGGLNGAGDPLQVGDVGDERDVLVTVVEATDDAEFVVRNLSSALRHLFSDITEQSPQQQAG